MKISRDGVPVVILSHRKRVFLPQAVASLRQFGVGITDVIVVDDSGDVDHLRWLDDHGYQYTAVGVSGNLGYLAAMQTVWEVARKAADVAGVEHVLLWEEDFIVRRRFSTRQMGHVLDRNERLAHLNLQRQSVYKIERRFGYMESHQRRGYGLTRNSDDGIAWVGRRTPFTTNPGLIKREVLDIDWPPRHLCDTVEGGAEPAMSHVLETEGWHFGWLGGWNNPTVRHIGAERKTGTGY